MLDRFSGGPEDDSESKHVAPRTKIVIKTVVFVPSSSSSSSMSYIINFIFYFTVNILCLLYQYHAGSDVSGNHLWISVGTICSLSKLQLTTVRKTP